jgi:hypothetical protein
MHRHSRFLFAAMLACAAAVGQTTQTVTGTVTFQVPTPIAGPQGPQGAPGTNGTNGAPGATGAPGPQGIAGNTPSAAAVAALLATMPGFAQTVAVDLAALAPGAAPPPVSPPPVTGKALRPSYNTGNGFFVLNGTLYDANGNEFRMRGVNRNHYDSGSQPGIAKSGANAVRIFVETNWGQTPAGLANIVQTQHINNKEVPIPTAPITAAGAGTSCNTTTATLTDIVSNWVATAANWTPLNKYQIVNIANEWGPANSTVWRDSYISAVASMRAAGYLGTLMIDSGGCGQDPNDLINYAAAVLNSDPQKNVMFGFHLYGLAYAYPPGSTLAQAQTIFAGLAALKSQGVVVAITEFGPGRGIGPSPTDITPAQVITTAEANQLGWLAWAWDDNNLAACKASDTWFSMTFSCGVYTQASDLTTYGKDVVLNPTYGLQVLAKPASIF